jgi:protein-tyrosine phosphatase
MARMAVDDGIIAVACTPHILPGVYDNTALGIAEGVAKLREALDAAGIGLELVGGADTHMAPDLVPKLNNGAIPTLGGTRYFLFEPPFHVMPPRLLDFAFSLLAAGYVPILTHPERLSWIEHHYDVVERLEEAGVLMQITAQSLTGGFGRRPRYWADRMIEEDRVAIVCTDAHDTSKRPPKLSAARALIAERKGEETASDLVANTPLLILENVLACDLRQP